MPKSIPIHISFEKQPEENVTLVAFVFDRKGDLISQSPVKNNAVELDLGDHNPREVQLAIAPDYRKEILAVKRIEELEVFKPYQPVLTVSPEGQVSILPVPSVISRFWCWRRCRVKGKVQKYFVIDNIGQYRPLCKARVHICEVDRIYYWIDKIPEYILKRIPDIVINPDIPIREKIPVGPFPGPGPDPGPIERIGDGQMIADGGAFSIKGLTEARELNAQLLPKFPEPVLRNLATRNTKIIKETLLNYFELFHPYFCYYRFLWPWFYHCTEEAVVYTDEFGRFDTTIFYNACIDQPDLYFWVEYLIDGVWTTVYHPNIPCNTHWNYVCGTDVIITVTDPRVKWVCDNPIPGEIVWIKTVGLGASVQHIKQTAGMETIQGVSFNNIGLSDYNVTAHGLPAGTYRTPFGSYLYFTVQFSSGLPATKIYYYRWSYRKVANADLSPVFNAFTPFTNDVFKWYTYEYFDGGGIKHFASNSVKLGPVVAGTTHNLYHIPPVQPSMAPFNVPELSPLWDQNTYSIGFDTTALNGGADKNGLYEFKLELFDKNGVLQTNLPKTIFQVPDFNTFSPSVNAPNQYLVLNGGGNADAFTMKLRIDNNKCIAEIYKIKINGVDASADCCGFVKYNPLQTTQDIEISFKAYHPNNLATFGFSVQKGTCSDPAMSNSTNIPGPTSDRMVIGNANGYARDVNSIFRKLFTHNQLLGICAAGGKAAFAENLGVYALATDGNSRLSGYDDSGTAAFALEP